MRLLLLLPLSLVTSLWADNTDDYYKKYQSAYEAAVKKQDQKLEEAKSYRDDQVTALTKKYIELLEKIKVLYTKKGELEKAIKVRNEIDALQKKLEANAPIEAPKPEVVKKPEVVEKPASFIRLVDLKPKESKVGYGTLEIGIEKEVLNKKCPETISAHASSRLLYDIPKGSRMFTAIGVGRMIRKKDHAIFDLIVKVDGKELHRAKISPGITAKIEVKLPFAAKNIELIADSKGPRWADDAYWCWPRFHKKTLNINDDRGW